MNRPVPDVSAEAIPASSVRVTPALYRKVRAWLLENDEDAPRLLDWAADNRHRPATPEALAGEVIWIILCAGRSAQAARTIEAKVWMALRDGRPVVEAFGYRAKAEAIERAWRDRDRDFATLQEVLAGADPGALVSWCQTLPFVGADTKYQLAKNFGIDVCKPDIWLCRLAGIPDRPRRPERIRFPACMALCRGLAETSGDRVAVVDTLLWLACNKGVLRVGPEAAEVRFAPDETIARKTIF